MVNTLRLIGTPLSLLLNNIIPMGKQYKYRLRRVYSTILLHVIIACLNIMFILILDKHFSNNIYHL